MDSKVFFKISEYLYKNLHIKSLNLVVNKIEIKQVVVREELLSIYNVTFLPNKVVINYL